MAYGWADGAADSDGNHNYTVRGDEMKNRDITTARFILTWFAMFALCLLFWSNYRLASQNTELIKKMATIDELAYDAAEGTVALIQKNTDLIGQLNDKDIIITETLRDLYALVMLTRAARGLE